jgi:hypothetical protein
MFQTKGLNTELHEKAAAVLLIEQNLGLVNFRPSLRISRIVSLVGTVGCLFAMFIENPEFSLVAIAFVVIMYGILLRWHLRGLVEETRSSGMLLMGSGLESAPA